MIWFALLLAQSLGGGLVDLINNLTEAMARPFRIRWTDRSLVTIIVCIAAYVAGMTLMESESSRKRDGEEHGSATWGSPREVNAMFAQKQNKLLTRHVRLGLDTHIHRRSLNVLVIGGSGAGKSRSYVVPSASVRAA